MDGSYNAFNRWSKEEALLVQWRQVLQDVRNELVSLEAARRDYGVVIDEKTLALDLEATKKLRSAGKE